MARGSIAEIQAVPGFRIRFILAFFLLLSQSICWAGDNLCSGVYGYQLMKKIKVAAVQFPLNESVKPDDLLQKISDNVLEAKKNQANVVVFPELITSELINWQSEVSEAAQLREIAQKFSPKYIEFIKALAIKNQISILAGSTPRVLDRKIYNTAIMVLADGRVLLQDKIFLTPDEKIWGWTPGQTLNVFETPWGRSAITICFDSEFPMLSQMLTASRPEVFFVPSWTSTEAGFNRVDWSTKARAVEHYAYVIKTGTVPGRNSTQPHFGNATILGPQDYGFQIHPLEGLKNTSAIIYGDLDLELLRERREQTGYYPGREASERTSPVDLKVEGSH